MNKNVFGALLRIVFTRNNTIETYKVFKAPTADVRPYQTITIVTIGGSLNKKVHITNNLLALQQGQIGTFMCVPVTFPDLPNYEKSIPATIYECYSSKQGFLEYGCFKKTITPLIDVVNGNVPEEYIPDGEFVGNDPFTCYEKFASKYYPILSGGKPYQTIKEFEYQCEPVRKTNAIASTIYSVVPNDPTVPLAGGVEGFTGISSYLKISGCCWVPAPASVSTVNATITDVFFHNGNYPVSNPVDVGVLYKDIILWDDDMVGPPQEIVVNLHGHSIAPASEDRIRVRGSSQISSSYQRFSYNNIYHIDNGYPAFAHWGRPYLHNQNGSGGHTFRINSAFDSQPGFKNALESAIKTWQCATQVNFQLDPVPTPGFPGWGNRENNIQFTKNLLSGSSSGTVIYGETLLEQVDCFGQPYPHWFKVLETDINILNDPARAAFHVGACPVPTNKVDLESVLLHELGHALLLNHLNNEMSIMAPKSISPGDCKRQLFPGYDDEGGKFVVKLSSAAANLVPNFNQNCFDNQDRPFFTGKPMIPVPVPIGCANSGGGGSSIEAGLYDSQHQMIITVSPNPFNDKTQLNIKNLIKPMPATIELVDIQGRKLYTAVIDLKSGDNDLEVEKLNSLSAGMYTLVVITTAQVQQTKIIKN